MIQTDIQKNIATCSLNRGVTNPLNANMIHTIHDELDKVEKMQNVHGVILTSGNSKFYSIGLDLPELFPLTREEFTKFFQDFSQLCVKILTFPKPVIAMINGHAIAGGCILTLACDYRFAREGNIKMGLNEIKLGVPVPYIAECILKDLISIHQTRYVCETGEFFSPTELLAIGLIDEVVPEDTLREYTHAKINKIANLSLEAYTKIKEIRNEQILERFEKNYKRTTEEFVQLWYSPFSRERLEEAMKKF